MPTSMTSAESRSKAIITSREDRYKGVDPIVLKGLPPDDARKLFYRRLAARGMEEIAEETATS